MPRGDATKTRMASKTPPPAQFVVRWVDRFREPTQPPNPRFPHGVDINGGQTPACFCALPYPAKRCGYYVVECAECGVTVACTTAGRPDDPRSIMIPCKEQPPR